MKSAPIRSEPVPERHWIVAHPLLAQGGGTVPQEQPGGGRVEGGEPFDRQVLLVVSRGEHPPLGLDDDGEDPGLELLRAVSPDAEVQPSRGGVRAEGLGDAQDGVGRGLGDGVEAGEGVGGSGGGGRHFLRDENRQTTMTEAEEEERTFCF